MEGTVGQVLRVHVPSQFGWLVFCCCTDMSTKWNSHAIVSKINTYASSDEDSSNEEHAKKKKRRQLKRNKKFEDLIEQEKKGQLKVIDREGEQEAKEWWNGNFARFLQDLPQVFPFTQPLEIQSMGIRFDTFAQRAFTKTNSLHMTLLTRKSRPSDPVYGAVWKAAARPPWPTDTLESAGSMLTLAMWEAFMMDTFGVTALVLAVIHSDSGYGALLGQWLVDGNVTLGMALILVDVQGKILIKGTAQGTTFHLRTFTEEQRHKTNAFQYVGLTFISPDLFKIPKT